MQLSKKHLKQISSQTGLVIPNENLFTLPEKVLQFGTGVLLRGLPDYFIDKANRYGIFNGRVVLVKSTSNGGTDAFSKQDGLYTLCIRGLENGKEVEETIINSSVSRVLSAKEDWNCILECAHNPAIEIIISNTTEIGITLMEDDIHLAPPRSFPGKLLAFLYERFRKFSGHEESGMVIIPTELIPENGTKLRAIVLELAIMNQLGNEFNLWLETANHFCNSLVDRIVPGKLPDNDRFMTEKKLGYKDNLMIMAESFRLWAIESDSDKVKQCLSFSQADEGVVIAPDIERFRELKLRLLNGTHTFTCGLAFLAGFTTVREAMNNEVFSAFVHQLAIREIASAICGETISQQEAREFAMKVMDRFRNPFLDHAWINIALQYSSKMKLRNIPLMTKYFSKTRQVPDYMALGFAGYLFFMKCRKNQREQYTGHSNGSEYLIEDDHAGYFSEKWRDIDHERMVDNILTDQYFWGNNLAELSGLSAAIKLNLRSLMNNGVMTTIRRLQLNKTEA